MFLNRITSQVDLAMSVCPYKIYKIAKISETMMLGLGIQILGLPVQRKFVSAGCHAHINAHFNTHNDHNTKTRLPPTFF